MTPRHHAYIARPAADCVTLWQRARVVDYDVMAMSVDVPGRDRNILIRAND